MKRSILILVCLAVLGTAPACKKKDVKSGTTVKRTYKRTIENGNDNKRDKKQKKAKKTTTSYKRKSNGYGSATKKKQSVTKEITQPSSYDISSETMQR